MPEQDFELYLSLLSRFLRLKPAQHAEIADELRDHLEERLEELAARGLSHEEAIRKALDEFGDAAELANHFTRAAHIRRRRLIMRCTAGTVAALAAMLLVATAFWPATPHNPIVVNAIAESPAAAPPEPIGTEDAILPPGEKWGFLRRNRAAQDILAKLDKPTEVNFVELPLEDSFQYLSQMHKINIWADKAALASKGIQLDAPVTLQHSGVSFRSTLKLLLEPLGLTYVVEDEVLKITTQQKATNVIGVYNIRDMVGPQAALLGADGNSELPGMGTSPMSAQRQPAPIHFTSSLAELVTRTIAPDTWIDAGGDGLAIQYDGVLVIRNSQVVHEEVRSFLKLLHSTLDAD